MLVVTTIAVPPAITESAPAQEETGPGSPPGGGQDGTQFSTNASLGCGAHGRPATATQPCCVAPLNRMMCRLPFFLWTRCSLAPARIQSIPRTLGADAALAIAAGVSIIFAPSVEKCAPMVTRSSAFRAASWAPV